jgi:glucose-1-phosphate adenylyltransferase
MSDSRILAFVLAGGEGRRLRPLTADRPKPAVELGEGYCLIDFALANLVNSGVPWIYLLVQYKPGPLIEHVARVWRPALVRRGCVLRCIAPDRAQATFGGTADAVRRNLHLARRHEPDAVAVLEADQVYRMDLRQMLAFHRGRGAAITVAAAPLAPDRPAGRSGVLRADAQGRVREYHGNAAPGAAAPAGGGAFASMGGYLFDPAALFDVLADRVEHGGSDLARDVLPDAVRSGAAVFAYDFSANSVPGARPHAYWRDIDTLQALAEARRDAFAGPMPSFDLHSPAWPLHPAPTQAPVLALR